MISQTDRSSVLDYQRCPRLRYYSRHFNGTGIQRKSKSLPLIFGSAFHEGVEILLKSFFWNEGRSESLELAVGVAKKYLKEKFDERGVEFDFSDVLPSGVDPIAYSRKEQIDIAEGLLRAWWTVRGEQFFNDFEVLEVEKEGVANLGNDVELLFRPDGLVREKSTGDLYVISWKTASTFGQYTINSCNTDMQSLSEVFGLQKTNNVQIEGVNYLFAVKGQRRMDDWLGFKVQSTPLAYGWCRKGPTTEDDEWAYTYSFTTEDGKNTKLGKGFKKFLVSEFYPGGVKGWIEALAAQEITPRHQNALEGVFPQSLPVSRRVDEIESWRRQTVAQEERIRNSVRKVELTEQTGGDVQDALDVSFPQHTARCNDYSSRCSMWDICFNPAVKADPLGSNLYQIRVSNHPERQGEDE